MSSDTQTSLGQSEFGEDRDTDVEESGVVAGYDGARYSQPDSNDGGSREIQYPNSRKCCQRCGRSIPQHRRRIIGDNNDVVWACGECVENESQLINGAGAKPDYPIDAESTEEHHTTREARRAVVPTVRGGKR